MTLWPKICRSISAGLLLVCLITPASATEPETPLWQRVSSSVGDAVIVPMTSSETRLLQILCGHTGDTPFTPTPEEVRLAEAGLVEFLRSSAPAKAAGLGQKTKGYRRQYGGVVVGKDKEARRQLLINASCSAANDDWLRRVIAVKDGGSCYYQLTFELHNRTFTELHINGEA